MTEKTLNELIAAADTMAHVCAFVSGRLDICGYDAKNTLSLIAKCCENLDEVASSWWKVKGSAEDLKGIDHGKA